MVNAMHVGRDNQPPHQTIDLLGDVDVNTNFWNFILKDEKGNLFEPDSISTPNMNKGRIELFFQHPEQRRMISVYYPLYMSEFSVFFRKKNEKIEYGLENRYNFLKLLFYNDGKEITSCEWELKYN